MKKLIKTSLIFGFLVVILCISAWLYVCPVFKPFPQPTGSYLIGTQSLYLVDQQRIDPYSSDNQKRALMVRMWYPASTPRDEKYPYLGSKMPIFQKIYADHSHIPYAVSRLLWSNIKTHTYLNAPLASTDNAYPVILFSHGLLGLPTDFYASFIENVASHGYIVVAIDHPYFNILTQYPDGTVVSSHDLSTRFEKMRPAEQNEFLSKAIDVYKADMKFVVDELEKLNQDSQSFFYNHLDLNRLGVMGHSAGGTAAIEFCRNDDRCKAAIDLDGWYDHVIGHEELKKPTLLMFASKSIEVSEPAQEYLQRKEISREQYYEREEKIAQHKKNICKEPLCSMVIIPDADHGDFSDPILFKWPLRAWNEPNPYKMLGIINEHIMQFLETYLK